MRRFMLLAGLLTLALACGDSPTEMMTPTGPSDVIQDATRNDGNQAFFWLAPIMKDPSHSGTFNPNLKPLVVICELDTTLVPAECKAGAPPVNSWTVGSGLKVSIDDEHYGFEWHTDQNDDGTATDYDGSYRIQVFLTEEDGSERLGYADVQFFSNGRELKDIQTGETIALRDGRTLPGRFRIEQGVSCNGEADCGEAVIGSAGGTVTTESAAAGVEVPENAVDGDILITIRKVDPATQPWGDCLPTGLRQEEGCYEFDTEPALGDVNEQDAFNTDVTVGVCIDPAALRPENLTLHKYDPENAAAGVTELPGTAASFLACDEVAYTEPDGLYDRLASAAGRLLRPMATLVGGRPLYASDTGRGGLTDAFSFIGWAEPVAITAAEGTPTFALPGAVLSPVIDVATTHNHPAESVLAGSGATLRIEYTDPLGNTTLLPPLTTDGSGQVTPSWTFTDELGTHTLTISTRQEIPDGSETLVVADPTEVFTLEIGAYATADACDNHPDCGQAVVGPDGDVVTTDPGHAGVSIPGGALDEPVLVTIQRVDPGLQPWGDCLPTGLRQEEGCYDFDTEPALSDVNDQDAFNTDVTVAVCIDPAATRPDRLTLHKYDPEHPSNGVVELPGAQESFLSCDDFAYAQPEGLVGRLAAGASRLLAPLAGVVGGRPLYASDTGRGGLTDAFSFIGWAEPVALSLTTEPDATTVGITDVVVTATTAHNHGDPALAADGATIRFEHTDPTGNVTVTEQLTSGTPATARISLTAQGGTHNVRVSTQQEILIDSDLLIAGATGGSGLFAAPTITFLGEPTLFLVPDPTPIEELGDLTIFGLVSRWDADDTEDPFADRVGPNHGGVTGAVDPSVDGVDGNAFSFDGSGGMMTAPVEGIADAGRFTVAGWVKLDPTGSPFEIQRFVSMGGGNGEKAVLRQESGGTDVARQAHFYGGFGADDGTGSSLVHIRVPNELVEGCWQHVAGTYDGTQIAFYRDGALVATQDVPLTDRDASTIAQQLELGSSVTEGEFPEALWGTLDEVEVHNRALSAVEVRELAGRFTPVCDVTTGSIGGRVIDAETGEPIPSATVFVEGTELGTLTDQTGRYRILNVPAGTHTLRASMVGYQDATQTVAVTAGGFAGADLSIQAVPTFTVSGTVRYTGTGAGLPGIDVALYSTDQKGGLGEELDATQTDDFGQYGFTGVPDGTYGLVAADPADEYFDPDLSLFLGFEAVTVDGGAVVQDIGLVKNLDLSKPAHDATVGALPTLEWEEVEEAATYSVTLRGTGGDLFEGITGTTFQVPSPLENNNTYRWSVQAFNEAGEQVGGTLQPFDFTVSLADLALPFHGDFTTAEFGPEWTVTTSSADISVTTRALDGAGNPTRMLISSTAAEPGAFGEALAPTAASYLPLVATAAQPLVIKTEIWSAETLGGTGIPDSYGRLVLQGSDRSLAFGMKGPSSSGGDEGVHYQVTDGGSSTETFVGPYDPWNRVYTIIYDGAGADLYQDGNLMAADIALGMPEFRVAVDGRANAAGRVNVQSGDFLIQNAAVQVDLSQTSASLSVGETVDIDATGRDAGGAAVGVLRRWTSSNPSVATVDHNGVITAVAKGTATIIARVDGVTAQVAVTVLGTPIAQLKLDSEEGDFIGQGGTFDITYTPDNSDSFFARIESTVDSEPAFLRFTLGTVTSDSDNTFTSLSFATDQLGIPIQAGDYPDAQRAAFADPGHPGLDVSFQNRGCNELVGSFTIHEVTFFTGESGTEIETLSATFEQHCEGAEPALHGTFTYDAHGGP